VITPHQAMSNRQMSPAILLQSTSLLEFVCTRNKLHREML